MKTLKKLTAMALAAVMMVAVSVPAFASSGTYDAELYKGGTYGTDSQALSMGDPSIVDAEATYDGNITTITVNVQEMEYMTVFNGNITEMAINIKDSDGNIVETVNGNPATDGSSFVFLLTGDYTNGTQVFDTTFSINVTSSSSSFSYTHENSSADLVIYFPQDN